MFEFINSIQRTDMNLDTGADPPLPTGSHSHKKSAGMFMIFPMLV